MEDKLFKEIVTHLQVQGYVYPGSQIYGGLANAWDYGPLGVLIKNNVKSQIMGYRNYDNIIKPQLQRIACLNKEWKRKTEWKMH